MEIGVAEGVSALAAREVMAPTGNLYLVDPFHLSRLQSLNFMRRAAHRAVASCRRGEVIWIEEFSSDAVRGWNKEIDFLLIDGDHSEAAARRDTTGNNGAVMFCRAESYCSTTHASSRMAGRTRGTAQCG